MHQPISIRLHGVLDYAVGVLLLFAPYLLGFADGGPAQWTAQLVGGLTIIVSLFTDYPLGALHVVPFRAHLLLDVAMGVLLAASPWLFGFAGQIWWPHVLVGAIYIIVPALTQRS